MSNPEQRVVNTHYSVVLFFIFLFVIGWIFLAPSNEEENFQSRTVLSLENHTNDTITVYLTLNQSSGYVNDVNGIFGIKSTNKKQGSLILYPNDVKTYVSPNGLAINGNIAFNDVPLNCPYVGATLFEFNLNNEHTVVNAQETVDISCVAGVNAYGEINLNAGIGGNWTDNVHPDPITTIQNKPLYQNTGISGVFPYGCTNCINTDGAPDCKGRPSYATPNTQKICTVQRNATESGGTVHIVYLGKP